MVWSLALAVSRAPSPEPSLGVIVQTASLPNRPRMSTSPTKESSSVDPRMRSRVESAMNSKPTLIDPVLAGVLYMAMGSVLVGPFCGMDKNIVHAAPKRVRCVASPPRTRRGGATVRAGSW
jgi:hypothetical protein